MPPEPTGTPAVHVEQVVSGSGNYVTGTGDITVVSLSAAAVEAWAPLRELAAQVRQFWVEGVLEKSLDAEARLQLGMERAPDAVEHPWEQVLHVPDREARAVPDGRPVLDVFDDVGQKLLVLGAPGTGKTTTLLHLARQLLQRDAADPTRPVPVVFNLATWTRGRPLDVWLTAELRARYGWAEPQGRAWVGARRLLLLLDGLDEVPEPDRAACVAAINAFGEAYGVSGLAVCCRLAEYEALVATGVRLKLGGAVTLRPLTPGQVDAYLDRYGPRLAALRAVVREDGELRHLAETPLILNVMTLAYAGLSEADLHDPALDTVEERRDHLFQTYVDRMFERRGKRASPWTRAETVGWLGVLAREMRARHTSLFAVESLQPDWLPRPHRWAYALLTRGMAGLVLGVLLSAAVLISVERPSLGLFSVFGRAIWMSGLAGLLAGAWDGFRLGDRPPATGPLAVALRAAGLLVTYGLAFTILTVLFGVVRSAEALQVAFGTGMVFGLWFALFFSSKGAGRGAGDDIRPAERLEWSWPDARSGLMRGLLAGVGLGIVVVVAWAFIGARSGLLRSVSDWAGATVGFVVLGVAVCLPVFGVVGGLRPRRHEDKDRPNAGIRLSIRSALRVSLYAMPVATLAVGMVLTIYDLGDGLAPPWRAVLGGGLLVGAVIGVWYGGVEALRHYGLRLMLRASGRAPLRVVRLLDHAVALVFLRRAGGSYLFVHRFLLDHFAARASGSPAEPGPHPPVPPPAV